LRGILVSEGKRQGKWIRDWGLLRDGMAKKYGCECLYARYRYHYTFLPAIEFEEAPVAEARMALRSLPSSREERRRPVRLGPSSPVCSF
jgi:hypothetical protein